MPNANGAFTPDYSATGSEFIERRTGFTPSGQTPAGSNRRQGAAQNIVDENGNAIAQSFGQVFALTVQETEAPTDERNTLRNYIPAGSYASAVVLSGADAATNVADRESPVPVLFRITGPAITAARGGGRGAEINIEGCTVQGSAIGDLSSERVRVRLLTLTCIKRNGEVVEQAISGYMVGAGKAGVRGRVISREGGLVANAAIAGVLGGLANDASSATGNTDGANSLGEIVTGAATAAGVGGVQTAAQTLSEYYINRAEQYQPVITLNGGSVVELVFMEGISLR
ncbi:MAG: TraB/VirB10 family protein [Rhodobacteraceae bacterium]|nr:TraB/VirB10 family protein [Paracoccaceae bacterium]